MILRFMLACVLAASTAIASVLAQTPQTQQPPKDRKDYIIEAVEGQRNNANSGFAVCLGTYNDDVTKLRQQITDLNAEKEQTKKQIAELTAENTKLKKPADVPPAPAETPTPK